MKNDKPTTLSQRFGPMPEESGFKKRMRLHQGWWRTNVLIEEPGLHPKESTENICNTILNGIVSKKNFLSENAIRSIDQTLSDRKDHEAGLMEPDRLFNNLLSSQPLCFNFFGELNADRNFGLKVLQSFYPNLTKLRRVVFEYAPIENFTKDNSAFDIAFEVEINNKFGLIGWECKYTDTFSAKEYDKKAYREIFSKSNSFIGDFDELKKSRTNQLFRNQLIAEALLQNNKYSFVFTGLFCHHQDNSAIEIAEDFNNLLDERYAKFKVVTYSDFITNIQRLNIDWKLREWTMLLWARYCATILSDEIIEQLEK
jgi:hypothetical protein